MAEVDAEKVTVTVEVEVEWKHIENELCSAWEGGSNYWLECYGFRPPTDPADAAKVEYRYQNALYPGGACLCRIAEDETGEEPEELELTREKLIAGVKLFAQRYPKHFADMQTERGDANTGDLFLQLSLLGSIVYG
jgi:hypothetical protein